MIDQEKVNPEAFFRIAFMLVFPKYSGLSPEAMEELPRYQEFKKSLEVLFGLEAKAVPVDEELKTTKPIVLEK